MKYVFKVIGAGVLFIALCRVAAAPIDSLYIHKPIEARLIPLISPQPVSTPLEAAPEQYSEIKLFLNTLPKCSWCAACGSYARYTRLEAEKQSLAIGELTIVDPDKNRIKHLLMSGHRINYFYAKDGHRVYIDNTHNWGLILENNELHQHIKDKFGFDLSQISFKDIRDIK